MSDHEIWICVMCGDDIPCYCIVDLKPRTCTYSSEGLPNWEKLTDEQIVELRKIANQ